MNADEVRLLLVVADTLERQSLVNQAGIVRRAARELAQRPDTGQPESCLNCGGALVQPARQGRRRKWCTRPECERSRKGRTKARNDSLAAVERFDQGDLG